MPKHRCDRWLLAALACLGAATAADAQQGARLVIDHIDMKPTERGFYDATVGLVMTDPKLGKTGKVAFEVVIAHVHDADEAIDKVHDPISTLSADLQAGEKDLHRAP